MAKLEILQADYKTLSRTVIRVYDGVHFYTPFLFAGFGMTAHALEQQIGEQCDSSGVDNLETLHPDSIPAFAAVRGKHMPVCGV